MKCPYCNHEIEDQSIRSHLAVINGRKGGLVKSEKKTAAARANVKKATAARARKEK